MPPKKNLSRGSLSNWCDVDADADADISKTISKTSVKQSLKLKLCRPPRRVGVDIISTSVILHKLSTTASSDQHNFGLIRLINIYK